MTPTEREAIRAADEAQHRKNVDLYRADLYYHMNGRIALDPPPRRGNVLGTFGLIIAALFGIWIALVFGNVVVKTITRAVAVQIEERVNEN
ncbi:MAG: hypothetical protein H5U19_14325 [Rhodobacteraceae bacterium]|nr:hypothetical protein [Paracoccaceae bacterium]